CSFGPNLPTCQFELTGSSSLAGDQENPNCFDFQGFAPRQRVQYLLFWKVCSRTNASSDQRSGSTLCLVAATVDLAAR
ncbi:hypothetical protein, partial [Malikia spinosa]|uniref:hypothetical protein n=1 Tax=Malikia spinosa TaxID=86180 RepID=UPI002FDB572D